MLKLLDWADATGIEAKKKAARAHSIMDFLILLLVLGTVPFIFKEDAE
jgi:hypothetical protein